ncbi:hypothetical protein BFJ68_g14597 [Fusarium oxysporum]|uniref:Oxidoreductase n=1 Tax=Fusarium oxysporum TaxID=5507 RepID=A0A420PTK1_FUSOX|nr:hypothetical protein BFJ68_g14597 [Fusarium oxysporum]
MSAHDSSLRETNSPTLASYVSTHNDTYPFINPSKADLAGKSVFITGASKGIWKATAIRFDMAGCSKIILAARSDMTKIEAAIRDAAKKANWPQPLVHSIRLDLTSEESVKAAAETAKEILDGSLDILINNAGCLEEWKPVTESDPSEWWTWEVTMEELTCPPAISSRCFSSHRPKLSSISVVSALRSSFLEHQRIRRASSPSVVLLSSLTGNITSRDQSPYRFIRAGLRLGWL